MKKFNINRSVYIKLTEKGHEIINKRKEEIEQNINSKLVDREVDENGYTRFQLWELFQYFGNYFNIITTDLPFETDIYMDENLLEDSEIYTKKLSNK